DELWVKFRTARRGDKQLGGSQTAGQIRTKTIREVRVRDHRRERKTIERETEACLCDSVDLTGLGFSAAVPPAFVLIAGENSIPVQIEDQNKLSNASQKAKHFTSLCITTG
uniref:Uncharacterized protein n=1 Tax=Echeneis naucrates TaxID=173247 RepID=A0A665X3C4_ECHNA